MQKGVLRNFTKFTGKHLYQSLFFNKVAGLRPATLLKKRRWHRCFPVNFVKFLRTPFLKNNSRWLLLYLVSYKKYRIVSEHFFWKAIKYLSCKLLQICVQLASIFLGARTVLYEMRFIWNFVFEKFFSISKKLCPRFSKKGSVLVLLQKKNFPVTFCWVLLQKY